MASTLKDIARKLDLSVSTVSYALNNGPKPVSKDVAKRVQKAAMEMGYRPNRIAKSLVTGRTNTIGIVPIDVATDMLGMPYVHLALNGVFNTATRLRQDVLLFTGHDRNLHDDIVGDMLDGRVDGVVFINPIPGSSALKKISRSNLPYVIVSADDGRGHSYIVDNEAGSLAALEYLYSLGHRRIAHLVGKLSMSDAVIRRDTFLSFVADKGLELPAEYMLAGDYGRRSGYAAGLQLAEIQNRPTAIFSANDDMAFGLIDALRDRGIGVPSQISVAGFDDDPAGLTYHTPLTTIKQHIEAMACEALEGLLLQIKTGQPQPGKVFNPELIIRGSTAFPSEESNP